MALYAAIDLHSTNGVLSIIDGDDRRQGSAHMDVATVTDECLGHTPGAAQLP